MPKIVAMKFTMRGYECWVTVAIDSNPTNFIMLLPSVDGGLTSCFPKFIGMPFDEAINKWAATFEKRGYNQGNEFKPKV